jgi:hypothetical protein
MPMQSKSDLDINRKDIDKFLIFPTVICTPQYDKRFKSYAIFKSTGLLKFLAWSGLSNLRILNFWV